MIVTLAVAGPSIHSVSPTGGNIDSAVGPGVGFCVITVQPASGKRAACVGTVRTTVGARGTLAVEVAVTVGVACTWGRHPANTMLIRISKMMQTLRIHFSVDNSIEQFYQ